MSKVIFNEIVASAHGKVDGSSNVSYRKSYGCDHTYTWDKDTKVRQTPQRRIQQEAMRWANIAARDILHDAAATAIWMQRFQAQSEYRNFRPFIVAMKMREFKSLELKV